MKYDPTCKKCSRLERFLRDTKDKYPQYFCKPVPSFGDKDPFLLIVGLAPGMHGANQTGRPFTGDHAGIILYETLFKYGFSNKKDSTPNDNLQLVSCRITNAVKCLPPENKPNTDEVNNCNVFLTNEINELRAGSVVLALGLIAHKAILKSQGLIESHFKFSHGNRHILPNGLILYDSYHCSRYNTQTKRLTQSMFYNIFSSIKKEKEQ
ncbi:uracil-DNA glycosylase [Methylophilaceae bacterium]|nr:uracil-DNA glycosylase [Methylophilaceae bacterium]